MNIPTLPSDPVLALVSILAIILVTLIITRLIAFSMNRMKRFKKDMTAIYLIRDIITYVIYFIALMVILQFFGINLAGTLLSVGIVGIAVSFAAKDIISNLFSGIILIIGKSIKVGDTIEVDGKIIKPEQVLGPPRKGHKVTYSGDTTPCDEMVEFARDSTILIHESTYLREDEDKAEENFHSTSSDAATIAKESNSKQLLLTHISTRYTDTTQLLDEAKEIFENTKLAKDFMKIET